MSDNSKDKGFFEKLAPILFVLVLALSFAVGILWQKVTSLEKTTKNKAGSANNPQAVVPQDELQAGDVDPVSEGDYIRGNKNAKIALIEYPEEYFRVFLLPRLLYRIDNRLQLYLQSLLNQDKL